MANRVENCIENNLKIVARYDEVICEKASKHSLKELKTDYERTLQIYNNQSDITSKTNFFL